MESQTFRVQLVVKAISFGNLITSTMFMSSLFFKGTTRNTINYRLIFSIISNCFYSLSFMLSSFEGPEDECNYGIRDFLSVFAFFSFTIWTFLLSFSIYYTFLQEYYHADLVLRKQVILGNLFCLFLSAIPLFYQQKCEITIQNGIVIVTPSLMQGFLQILKYIITATVFALNIITVMKSLQRPEPNFAVFENRSECPKLVRRFVPFLILYNTCICPTFLNVLDYFFSNNTLENLSLWQDLLTQLVGILYVLIYFLKASADARIPERRPRNLQGSLLATPGDNLDLVSNFELSRRATPTSYAAYRQASQSNLNIPLNQSYRHSRQPSHHGSRHISPGPSRHPSPGPSRHPSPGPSRHPSHHGSSRVSPRPSHHTSPRHHPHYNLQQYMQHDQQQQQPQTIQQANSPSWALREANRFSLSSPDLSNPTEEEKNKSDWNS